MNDSSSSLLGLFLLVLLVPGEHPGAAAAGDDQQLWELRRLEVGLNATDLLEVKQINVALLVTVLNLLL